MDKLKIRQAELSDQDTLIPQVLVFEEQHATYDEGKLTDQGKKDAKENLERDL